MRLFDERHTDICFLDVHMPGLSGVDAANHIGRRAHLVFVTAYDHYAVEAFAQGALWRDGGKAAEAVVRTPLKDLVEQLDPAQFAQVHRAIVGNLRAILDPGACRKFFRNRHERA